MRRVVPDGSDHYEVHKDARLRATDYIYVNCFAEDLPEGREARVFRARCPTGISAPAATGSSASAPRIRPIFLWICITPTVRAPRCAANGNPLRGEVRLRARHDRQDRHRRRDRRGASRRSGSMSTTARWRACASAWARRSSSRRKSPSTASGSAFIDQPVEVGGNVWNVTALSVGNPHAVVFRR